MNDSSILPQISDLLPQCLLKESVLLRSFLLHLEVNPVIGFIEQARYPD